MKHNSTYSCLSSLEVKSDFPQPQVIWKQWLSLGKKAGFYFLWHQMSYWKHLAVFPSWSHFLARVGDTCLQEQFSLRWGRKPRHVLSLGSCSLRSTDVRSSQLWRQQLEFSTWSQICKYCRAAQQEKICICVCVFLLKNIERQISQKNVIFLELLGKLDLCLFAQILL